MLDGNAAARDRFKAVRKETIVSIGSNQFVGQCNHPTFHHLDALNLSVDSTG
jgi:hypothetical protein